MNTKIILLSSIVLLALASCTKPKPLDIEVPTRKDDMVIASAIVDDHSVLVSAGYSIGSIEKLENTNAAIAKELLIDSAIVMISEPGQEGYALSRIAPGLYGNSDMVFKPGAIYNLTVTDTKKGIAATAATTYLPNSNSIVLTPKFVQGIGNDSLLKLDVTINNANKDDHYFVSYSTTTEIREKTKIAQNTLLDKNANSAITFEPKKIQLIDGSKMQGSDMKYSFTVKASATDTMVVQVARIDAAYYNYLNVYKRTGYLINQLTAEPINLPTNIKPGYGYFALYQSKRYMLDLKDCAH